MTEIIFITFEIAIILATFMVFFLEFGILEASFAVIITLWFVIPLEIVVYNKIKSRDKDQKEYIEELIAQIKKETNSLL